jgi:hypothetical protein
MSEAADILYAIGKVYEEGARKSREWPFNDQAQVQAAVYQAMADEAMSQYRILDVS